MSDKGKETRYELVEIGRLIPYARNARTHSDAQIAQIAASIREFGFLAPIIISGDDTILCGHGSLCSLSPATFGFSEDTGSL